MLKVNSFISDPTATEDDDNAEEDEDKYVDEVDMPGTKVRSGNMCILYCGQFINYSWWFCKSLNSLKYVLAVTLAYRT